MLTKTSLNRLTESVSDRIVREVHLYNQKISEAISQENLRDRFIQKINGDNLWAAQNAWEFLEEHYPPIFTELLCVLRSERKDQTLKYPFSYQLKNIIRADVERLTADLNEFDSDSLLVEQLFEKIYPMLVEAKYIYFESEKNEPIFDLSVPVEEEDVEFAPLPVDALEAEFDPNTEPREAYDEGDWE